MSTGNKWFTTVFEGDWELASLFRIMMGSMQQLFSWTSSNRQHSTPTDQTNGLRLGCSPTIQKSWGIICVTSCNSKTQAGIRLGPGLQLIVADSWWCRSSDKNSHHNCWRSAKLRLFRRLLSLHQALPRDRPNHAYEPHMNRLVINPAALGKHFFIVILAYQSGCFS